MDEHQLRIVRRPNGSFWHFHDLDENQRFNVSDFECSISDRFNIVEIDGATRHSYLITNIQIVDEQGAGAIETFVDREIFEARLREIKYTPFLNFEAILNQIQNLPEFNRFIVVNGFELTGNTLKVVGGWIWKILMNSYTNPANLYYTIPFSSPGMARFVGVAANTSNGFQLFDGEESAGTPFKPTIDYPFLEATFVYVTDSTISIPTIPDLSIYDFVVRNGNLKLLMKGYVNVSGVPTINSGTDNTIEYGDFAHGIGDTPWTYWKLARYLNLTGDGNTQNRANYEALDFGEVAPIGT